MGFHYSNKQRDFPDHWPTDISYGKRATGAVILHEATNIETNS